MLSSHILDHLNVLLSPCTLDRQIRSLSLNGLLNCLYLLPDYRLLTGVAN